MIGGARLLVLAVVALVGVPAARAQPSAGRGTPVAARALGRGVVLAESDIAFRPAAEVPDASVRAASVPNASVATGWVTRRPIAAGEALRQPAVAPPAAVQAGTPVELVWRDGTLELRLRGIAANSAPLGGRVAVRVDRRRFEGIAAGPALVRLP